MKIKFKVFLPTVIVMLFVLSLTGYAHGKHHDESDETKANTSIENLSSASAEDLVSHWLETRLVEESSVPKYARTTTTPIFVFDEFEGQGGGWCNHCSCWTGGGCDPNGNCSNGHYSLCGGGLFCPLHPILMCFGY